MIESIELTTREYAMVFLLSKGFRNKEIAAQTGLSVGTVKAYFARIGLKSGYRTRLELGLAFNEGVFCECNKRGVGMPKVIKNPEQLYGIYSNSV